MKKESKDKKRILMLNYEFPPLGGGAGNATYYLLKEFAKSKYKNLEIDLITSSVDKYKKEKFSDNITIHFLDIGKKGNLHYQSNKDLLKYSKKSYNYCKKLINNKLKKEDKKYDLIHAFFGIPCGYIAMKLKNKYKIPYIVSLRGSDVPFYNKRFEKLDKIIFQKLSKKIWKKSKAVITNSQGLKDLALKTSPKQKISIIYNGIDIGEFKPKNKKSKKQNKNKKLTIISTGRLIQRKGYQYLIPSLKGLDVKLQLIGDGNLTNELKELAKQNKVDVEFLGKKKHKDIVKYLQKADVFCLPSLNEGMSNSILEAMACGLPIITTNTGGSEELIKGNGFRVKKSSIEDLTDIIYKYLKNPKLINEHGIKSRSLARKMNWENIAREYIGEYGE
jgi:L-malate glycosyltransferase